MISDSQNYSLFIDSSLVDHFHKKSITNVHSISFSLLQIQSIISVQYNNLSKYMLKKILLLTFLVFLTLSTCETFGIKEGAKFVEIGTVQVCCEDDQLVMNFALVGGKTFDGSLENIKAQVFESPSLHTKIGLFEIKATASEGETSYTLIYPLPAGSVGPYYVAAHVDVSENDGAWVGNEHCYNSAGKNGPGKHCYFVVDYCSDPCVTNPFHPLCPACQEDPNSEECLQFCGLNQQIYECYDLCSQEENKYSDFCPICLNSFHPLCSICQADSSDLRCVAFCETNPRIVECQDPCDLRQNFYSAECPFCTESPYHPECPVCQADPSDVNCWEYCILNPTLRQCRCQSEDIYGYGQIPIYRGWGWEIPVEVDQTISNPLYMAPQNQRQSSGTPVGSYTVEFDGTNVTVEFSLFAGVYIDQVHINAVPSGVNPNPRGTFLYNYVYNPSVNTVAPVSVSIPESESAVVTIKLSGCNRA